MLVYSLIHSLPLESALCLSFVSAYTSLWADIPLAKLANLYEKLNKDLDAEESTYPSATPRTEENQGDEGKESPVSEL
jgi:hypothetical protein